MRRCLSTAAIVLGVLAFEERASAQSPAAAPDTLAVGDWQLAPALELRTRGQFRANPVGLRVQDAYGVLERTRIGIGAAYGLDRGDSGVLRAQVTLQDARAWGVPPPTGVLGAESSGLSSTGMYEAYVEARTSAARPAWLRVGRQAVTWGDGRLLSNADWSPVARTLDAARGHVSAGIFDFELLAAMLATPRPLGSAFGDTGSVPDVSGTQLYGAQAAGAFAPLLKLELSLLARVTRGAGLEGETYVASLRVFGDARGWRYAVEGVGEAQVPLYGVTPQPAWAVAGYVEKRLDGLLLAPSLRLEGDYASGGSYTSQFDPILPDVHELHGAMDLFSWSDTLQGSARVSVVPWAEGRLAVEYRYARQAPAGGSWLDAYGSYLGSGHGQELGNEIDAWAAWRPWPVLELTGGYSLFVLSEGAREILTFVPKEPSPVASPFFETATLSHFAYLQATLRVP